MNKLFNLQMRQLFAIGHTRVSDLFARVKNNDEGLFGRWGGQKFDFFLMNSQKI